MVPNGYKWASIEKELPKNAMWYDEDPKGTEVDPEPVGHNLFKMDLSDATRVHHNRHKDWPSDAHGLCGFVIPEDRMEHEFEKLRACFEDAEGRSQGKLASPFGIGPGASYEVWQQIWPNTGCGFGGIVGHAFTHATTVIVFGHENDIYVYHSGRFAYHVKNPNSVFQTHHMDKKLLGASDYVSQYELNEDGP